MTEEHNQRLFMMRLRVNQLIYQLPHKEKIPFLASLIEESFVWGNKKQDGV